MYFSYLQSLHVPRNLRKQIKPLVPCLQMWLKYQEIAEENVQAQQGNLMV